MKILIATDGSNASASVIKAACRIIGKPEKTTVKIISAVEPVAPMAAEPFAISAQYYGEIEDEMCKQAKNAAEQAAADLKKICPRLNDVSSGVLRGQTAARAIVEAANDWKADLIVVGSHGYGFWSRIARLGFGRGRPSRRVFGFDCARKIIYQILKIKKQVTAQFRRNF